MELSGLPIPASVSSSSTATSCADVGLRRLQETLVHSRGLGSGRTSWDGCQVTEGERFDQAGLELADTQIGARAPLATQRWLGAMLAGAKQTSGIDDRARVRLVRRLDPRLAAVPWGATRLPLSLSEQMLLGGLRSLGALTGRPLPAGDSAVAGLDHAADGRGVARSGGCARWAGEEAHGPRRGARRMAPGAVAGLHRGDPAVPQAGRPRRGERPEQARGLWREHLGGADHADSLGVILGIELWMRLFVDRDRPPSLVREGFAVRLVVFGHNDWWIWEDQGLLHAQRGAHCGRWPLATTSRRLVIFVDSPRFGGRTHRPPARAATRT